MPLVYARTVIKRPPASIRLRSATYSASPPTCIRHGGRVPLDYPHPLVGLHALRAVALDQFRLENGERRRQQLESGRRARFIPGSDARVPGPREYHSSYDEEIGDTLSPAGRARVSQPQLETVGARLTVIRPAVGGVYTFSTPGPQALST